MKKPYLNREDRFNIENDTLSGGFAKFDFELQKYKRSCYRNYGIFGYLIFRYNVKTDVLNPLNEEIKRNWE